MKYFPATKLVWLMSCSTYEARNVHNSKHTHCCRCLSSKIITEEQRKSHLITVNIFYITVQNNAELEQSRSMAESTREILSSNGKISPAHKIAFENWIFLSTLPVEVRLQNSFLLHNLYWKCPREGPQGQLRGEQIDCGIWEILNYNWNNPKLENFCKRKRHQLQLNASTAERANSPAQWEKCNNDDWAEIHLIFLEK